MRKMKKKNKGKREKRSKKYKERGGDPIIKYKFKM